QLRIAQCFGRWPEQHNMWTSDDPMVVSLLCCRRWVGITRTTNLALWSRITPEHVGDAKLIGWRRLLGHHRVNEFERVSVRAHPIRSHDHTRKSIGALAQSFHLVPLLGPDHGSILGDRFRRRGKSLLHIIRIRERLLSER